MTKRVFAVAAHPDDIEIFMGGTLIRLKQAGCELHYMNIANGCCGSATLDAGEITRVRLGEAQTAAASIGAVFHPPLCDDLEIFYEKTLLARLGAIMREVAPDILLTLSPADYMEDHQNASRLAVAAIFFRNIRNYSTIPPRGPVFQPVTVYHAQPYGNRDQLGQVVRPAQFVDIGGVMAEKTAMLACHRSQKEWLDVSQGLDSYLTAMQDFASEVGAMSGRYAWAEGWRRHHHLGFCAPESDPLAALVGPR